MIYKISDTLILNKRCEIQQYISFKKFISLSMNLNFKYKRVDRRIQKIIDKSYEEFRLFIINTNRREFIVSTNSFMVRKLKELEKENIIILKKMWINSECK